jgi:diguanylate cyclase (GGDEF)-like protein
MQSVRSLMHIIIGYALLDLLRCHGSSVTLFKVFGPGTHYLSFEVYNRRMIALRKSFQPALLLVLSFLTTPLAMAQVVESVSTNLVPLVTEEDLGLGFSLHGRWRFQLGDDASWSSPALDDTGWDTRRVPDRWALGGYPSVEQFAWYRLSIELESGDAGLWEDREQLGIRIGKVMSAYELYAGGKLLGGRGKLPPLSEPEYDREYIYPLPTSAIAKDGTVVIALRVWGGEGGIPARWGSGPFDGEFKIGNYAGLVVDGVLSQLPQVLACLFFVGFGLYHIYLYRRNPQLSSFLWFGLMAVNIGIYGLMLSQLKYAVDIPFLTYKKIEFGAIYLFPALAIQTVWSLLDEPIGRYLRTYQLSFPVAALIVVLVPGHDIHAETLRIWQVWTVPALVLTPVLMLRKLRDRHPEARTLFLGVLIFIAACVNDLLIDFVAVDTTRLVPFGFVAIMLAMAVSLANRFTANMSHLEQVVAERTQALSIANEQLGEAARVDPLTGLYNRRGFREEAEVEVQRMFRGGKGFSIVLADIDNFKSFNDKYGHACGDHVLSRAAAILRDRIRDIDRLGRWGGEEFILLLPETDSNGAALLAEKLRDTIGDNVFDFEGQRLSITLTFGVATFRKGETLEVCIARADAALYEGKAAGRNRVMVGSQRVTA